MSKPTGLLVEIARETAEKVKAITSKKQNQKKLADSKEALVFLHIAPDSEDPEAYYTAGAICGGSNGMITALKEILTDPKVRMLAKMVINVIETVEEDTE